MTKDKTLKPSAVYKLLELQMTILAALFGILSIISGIILSQMIYLTAILGIFATFFGLLIYRYASLKSEAEEFEKKKLAREMKWTDEHPNTCDVRFSCYNKSQDLDFLYVTAQITKKSGGRGFLDGNYNFIARESAFYLPVGIYEFEFNTREYEKATKEVFINDSNIGERLWFSIDLQAKTD